MAPATSRQNQSQIRTRVESGKELHRGEQVESEVESEAEKLKDVLVRMWVGILVVKLGGRLCSSMPPRLHHRSNPNKVQRSKTDVLPSAEGR